MVKVRPSDVAASGDNAWYADVTGVIGDAVGAPRGDLAELERHARPALAPGEGGTQPATQPGVAPAAPNGPGAGTPPVFNPQVSAADIGAGADTALMRTLGTHRGFTLIELMVAVFITAIVLAMGYGAINQALNNHDALDARQERLLAVQTTMRLFAQDFTQLAPRPVRQPLGDGWLPALLAGTSTGTGMGLSSVSSSTSPGRVGPRRHRPRHRRHPHLYQ